MNPTSCVTKNALGDSLSCSRCRDASDSNSRIEFIWSETHPAVLHCKNLGMIGLINRDDGLAQVLRLLKVVVWLVVTEAY